MKWQYFGSDHFSKLYDFLKCKRLNATIDISCTVQISNFITNVCRKTKNKETQYIAKVKMRLPNLPCLGTGLYSIKPVILQNQGLQLES